MTGQDGARVKQQPIIGNPGDHRRMIGPQLSQDGIRCGQVERQQYGG